MYNKHIKLGGKNKSIKRKKSLNKKKSKRTSKRTSKRKLNSQKKSKKKSIKITKKIKIKTKKIYCKTKKNCPGDMNCVKKGRKRAYCEYDEIFGVKWSEFK